MKRSPLRSDPDKVRAWKERSRRENPLSRGTPLRPVNPARRARRFEAGFGSDERVRFVQRLPCAVCGAVPSENAHVQSRGAGGGPEDIAPLCKTHHREQHRVGVRTFRERYNTDLQAEARRTEAAWQEHQRGED